MQKSVKKMASIIKELIPSDSLEGYTLQPVLSSVADDEKIQRGIASFKEFLINVYDQLITDGDLYEKPTKQMDEDNFSHDNVVSLATGYPFINHVTSILINIGYYSSLDENCNLMVVDDRNMLAPLVGPQGGAAKQKISAPKVIEALRFLTSCGLHFDGIDLTAKRPDLVKPNSLRIEYPDNPDMLIGLKVMAIAHNEMSTANDYYVFQRCDYRLLRAEAPNTTEYLKTYIRALPENAREFILRLHQRYLDNGLTCKMKMHYFGVIFSYLYKSNIVWEFLPTPEGCYITAKASHIGDYADEIKTFHAVLQEKISTGYGCEKKRFGKPCQKGCHGYSFLLNDSISEIECDIEKWFDKEVLCLRR